jgi:ribosome-associated heat shock protein Hsp15
VEDQVRIDKWLWAVRLFKTRSLATEACRSGKISVAGNTVKASREVKTGDIVEISKPPVRHRIRVLALLHNRVGAKFVAQYMEDLTPPEELEKAELLKASRQFIRPRGLGRPSKKERRDLDGFLPD